MPRDESRAPSTTDKARRRARTLSGARARGAQRKRSSASATTQKPSVAIVGAGRLGAALALALAARGYRIAALVAQHKARARRAARLFRDAPPRALAAREL